MSHPIYMYNRELHVDKLKKRVNKNAKLTTTYNRPKLYRILQFTMIGKVLSWYMKPS